MKKETLDFLVCPQCKSELEPGVDVMDGAEMMEGVLTCRFCKNKYPIRSGIPRFVQASSYADNFGYEWHRFKTVQLDSVSLTSESETAFRKKTGWAEKDIRGALVLDAGVGAGRFAEVVSRWGGQVVGIDLTMAVDAAFDNIGRRERVHLVQADIFALPFRTETFDVAYSIGVLHHTPDPQMAFRRVAGTVKKGGKLAIYVYAAGGLARYFSDIYRKATTKSPLTLLYYASAVAVPLYYLYRMPLVGRVMQTVAPISMHPKWRWRWLDTFDWYTPRYQWKHTYPEVFHWFKSVGCIDVDVLDFPICVRGTKSS